jgi:hypothetical protein
MPETPYVEGIDIKLEATGQIISSVDIADTEARAKLEELEDYVDSMIGGIELITRADWETLTTAQKQAKGLVAIQDASSGYTRGELINGADYPPMPCIVYAATKNGGYNSDALYYDCTAGGQYQIIGVRKCANQLQDITVRINNTVQTPRYIWENSFPIYLELYICDVFLASGDRVYVSNSSTENHSGVQMFVLKYADANAISVYNALGNGQSSGFPINLTTPYLQVAKFGYYNSNNIMDFYEVNNIVKTSEVVNSDGRYWYGGSYVLTLRSSTESE